jgi:anion-transporting  ArsA/GET3 family ATPase
MTMRTKGGSGETTRALALNLRSEAAEAEGVITVGADPAAILEESRLHAAL